MIITVTKRIGKRSYHFQCDGANLFEMLIESKKLSFPDVDKCGVCGKSDLWLDAYETKGNYKYAVIRCNCGAKLNFGTADNVTYYLKTKIAYFKKQDNTARVKLLEEAIKVANYKRTNPKVGLDTYPIAKQAEFYLQLLKKTKSIDNYAWERPQKDNGKIEGKA